jgi:hypothetical protein
MVIRHHSFLAENHRAGPRLAGVKNSVTNQKSKQCGLWRRWRGLVLTPGVLLTLAGISHGQEALRVSMAGDVAAAAQQQANTTLGYYNLLLGPTTWRFGAGLGLEFTDNAELQPNAGSGAGDVIIQPSVDVFFHWPVTLKNSLDISLGAGYSEYLRHTDLSQFFINPGSGLSFDVYAGDFKINVHDRITITENAYQNAGVSGNNQNLTSMQNTAGASTLWDLDKVVSNLGFDHVNYASLSHNGEGQQPDGTSENLFVNSGVRVRPELLLGLEAGGSVITYNQSSSASAPTYPNAVQWSAGGFGSAKISEHMDVRLDAGYTVYTPDNSTTNIVTRDASGLYFSLSLSHRVNRILNYTLSAGRSADLAAYGQPQAYYFVRFSPAWNFLEKYSISTPIWWQQGKQINNFQAGGIGNYGQIGLGLNVSRSLTKKLSGSIGYQFVEQTSSQAYLNYTVSTLNLNLTYQF